MIPQKEMNWKHLPSGGNDFSLLTTKKTKFLTLSKKKVLIKEGGHWSLPLLTSFVSNQKGIKDMKETLDHLL